MNLSKISNTRRKRESQVEKLPGEDKSREERKKQVESLPIGTIFRVKGNPLKDVRIHQNELPGWIDVFFDTGEIESIRIGSIDRIIWQDNWRKIYKERDVK